MYAGVEALLLESNALQVRESEAVGGTLCVVVSWMIRMDGMRRSLTYMAVSLSMLTPLYWIVISGVFVLVLSLVLR